MFNIFLGIVFIAGGLSGRMTLIFTNSTMAIAILGFGLVALGIFQEVQKRKR